MGGDGTRLAAFCEGCPAKYSKWEPSGSQRVGHNVKLVKHKSPDLDALPRNPRSCLGQIKRTVWDRQALPPFRVKGIEDGNFRVELVRDVIPLVIWVPADLEDLIGDSGEDLVDSDEILFGIHRRGVEIRHWEVPAWAGKGFPDAGGSMSTFKAT